MRTKTSREGDGEQTMSSDLVVDERGCETILRCKPETPAESFVAMVIELTNGWQAKYRA
jgi:hypothetical protein